MLLQAVDKAFEDNLINVSDMDSAPITFAGYGEPLLRPDIIYQTAALIKEGRHGVPLRVKTNGLIEYNMSAEVAKSLKESGIDLISIGLLSDNPPQYKKIAQPVDSKGFGEVCNFVIACVEAGIEVECSAVEGPGVNVNEVRKLAFSLGAHNFSSSSYHE
jgi:TatD family-associated radical SAM protein